MPNWVENWLSIRRANRPVQDYIDGWRASSQNPGLAFSLTSFVPMPGGIWHYDWCVAHWGTHLDTDNAEIEILDDRQVCIRFGTAWSPPLLAVEALSRRHPEMELILDFGDPAMGFAGRGWPAAEVCWSEQRCRATHPSSNGIATCVTMRMAPANRLYSLDRLSGRVRSGDVRLRVA